ncbi:DUF305 domain-containing protein [Streptosporangium sp. NPDC051022]|uniref:DUF305 domain-containing protein n=1 Tax=Streptosporangium sp. NPDC051022 TaxID=3155752 RepID=UPI00341A2F23
MIRPPRPPRRWPVLAGAVVLVIALVTAGLGALFPRSPADDSVEAGFARDMQTHHAQAVRMSMIVRDRTTDAETRLLAYDIALSQQQQIGQMYAWLETWGLPQASLDAPMAWMRRGHGAMPGMTPNATAMPGMTPDTTTMPGMTPNMTAMPGMATPAQITRLERAGGRDAEISFLRLMIAHHRGGVQMAQAAVDATGQPQVRRLAVSIVAAQNSEIDLMKRMLTARGATDVPSPG